MNKNIFQVLFFLGISLASCKRLTQAERLYHSMNDPENKISLTIKSGDISMTARYLPESYLKLADSARNLEAGDYKNMLYFSFTIQNAMTSKIEKNKLLYLNFDIQQDFALLAGKDSLQAAICQKIEKGSSSQFEYLLVFERSSSWINEDFTLLYRDKIFGTGEQYFKYSSEAIKEVEKTAMLQ